MRKYLDLTTWIILFALLPFTVLIFLSQGSGPGDLFYPVKRGMENIILAGASFSPATKVAFRTDLTERRFKEAERLLLFQGQTTALTDFVGEVQITQEELFKLSSFEDKKELSDKLIAKIDEYEVKLAQVQTQIEQQTSSIGGQQEVQTPKPTSAPIQTITPQPAGGFPQTPKPTEQVPTLTPSPAPKPFIQIPFQPATAPTPAPILDTVKKEEVVNAVSDTREKLKEFKEKLKKDKEDAEVKEKIKEEREKLRENLKENKPSLRSDELRGEGKGSGRNDND